MSLPLEKVSTVNQTSMGSARLPLEVQQLIYSYCSPREFHNARNVCKWWRFASTDSLSLSRQLHKLPIRSLRGAPSASNRELDQLFQEAAHTLLLGLRVRRRSDALGDTEGIPDDILSNRSCTNITSTRKGSKLATVSGRSIALFDLAARGPPRLVHARPLNDLKETIGSGPWLKPTNAANHQLALSSSGKLLAVAQERTIQIYDLAADSDSFTINEYIGSASGHYICGIDFEQNDSVLRVRLSGRGTVLYLGTPKLDGTLADVDHWKSREGLKHTFLDTSTLNMSKYGSVQDQDARLAGLQLLRPLANNEGFLFAAQRHYGGESSHYILGYIHCSVLSSSGLTAEPSEVIELARLETFLSSWAYNSDGTAEHNLALWEDMPTAHEHHPRYALSPNGTLIVLAERDTKHIQAKRQTQLFAYRVPSERRLGEILEHQIAKSRDKWATLADFMASGDTRQDPNEEARHKVQKQYQIGRIPICLATVTGEVTELDFASDESGTLSRLTAVSQDVTRRWILEEV